jgi:hypothetical protein
MFAYIPIIKLTQRRKDAKNLGIFNYGNYGRTIGHDISEKLTQHTLACFVVAELINKYRTPNI